MKRKQIKCNPKTLVVSSSVVFLLHLKRFTWHIDKVITLWLPNYAVCSKSMKWS